MLLISTPIYAETIYTKTTQDIFALFERIGYTEEAWQNGVRKVPRVFLTTIPERWQRDSQQMPVNEKKTLFFRLTGPAVLHSNSLIKKERQKLIAVKNEIERSGIKDKQISWLLELAKRYKVNAREGINGALIDELLLRVDEIPVSLALAQAAEESGWGTSRFAVLGNALFGQWDFSGKGIKPQQQRKELGNYGIARFESPQESVNAYMLNLNSHRSYTSLRKHRARLRKSGKKVTGYELATKLDKYSERGEAYVDGLHTIMQVNNLAPADEAYLWDSETIYITPLEEQ
jgi:Bax protein